jgi:hypothetical protein
MRRSMRIGRRGELKKMCFWERERGFAAGVVFVTRMGICMYCI